MDLRALVLVVLGVLATALPWVQEVMSEFLSNLAPADLQCEVKSLQDGDSFTAQCGGERTRIRLHCIDAPEYSQRPWGRESREHLRRIMAKRIRLSVEAEDRYGRLVAQVWNSSAGVDTASINLEMVRAGRAVVYRRYCNEDRFYQAEEQARTKALGVWRRPGEHQRPWRYRRSQAGGG